MDAKRWMRTFQRTCCVVIVLELGGQGASALDPCVGVLSGTAHRGLAVHASEVDVERDLCMLPVSNKTWRSYREDLMGFSYRVQLEICHLPVGGRVLRCPCGRSAAMRR